MNYPIYYIVMALCLIFSAYFSATETAFSTINRTRLITMAEEEKNKRAAQVLKLADNYDRLLSTILIGNNIVNILLSSLATLLFVDLFKRIVENNADSIGSTVSTIVVTVVVLIFGEISPKSIAKDCPEKFAMFAAPLIRALMVVFTPITFFFAGWKRMLTKLFRLEKNEKMSTDEIRTLVDEIEKGGSIDEEEGTLLRNAIEFTELEAKDILTPRVDLEAFSIDTSKQEIAKMFTETKFSRLLVYEDSIDRIVGVLHQKDFFTEHGISPKSVEELMSEPHFVHPTEKINHLLTELQTMKSHIAVVNDEYGGTMGIVTLEDIIEELVGEIWDEHDEVVEYFKELEEDTELVDCNVSLDDFCEHFDIRAESESSSLGGWVTEMLDKIPEPEDGFIYENLQITVTEVDEQRVTYVMVHRVEIGEDEEEIAEGED